jgi:O-antigen/teichoic acid export membrane protein
VDAQALTTKDFRAPKQDLATGWRPLAAAMAKAGGGSVASGLLSALATKIVATAAGPAYLGLLATLQQTRQAALVAATANGQTALVRGASALQGRQRREFVRTSASITAASTLAVLLVMVGAPQWAARFAGMSGEGPGMIRLLAVAVLLSSTFVFLSSLLNALGGIAELASLQIIASAAMALGAWPAAVAAVSGKRESMALLLAFSSFATVAGACWMLAKCKREVSDLIRGPGGLSWLAARRFSATSATMLAGGFLASWSLLFVRSRITARTGLAGTGQFDAAWGISMNHASLVLASLQTYYLPAVSRLHRPEQRNAQISTALGLGALAAAAIIAAIALCKPVVLTILYSPAFRPAAAYLRWTLIGDYLKVSSWILSIALVGASRMGAFLVADAAAYLTFVIASSALGLWMGPPASTGIAFVAMYAAHLAACAALLWRTQRFFPERSAVMCWVLGFAAVMGVSFATWNLS